MKIGVAQLNSNDDIQQNFDQMKNLILAAESEKPEVIFFPENSLFFRINTEDSIKAINLKDKVITDLKNLCKKTQISIHFTTAILDNDDIFNASVLIDTKFTAKLLYKKIHLFDISLNEQLPMRESDVFSHGNDPVIFNIKDFKIGSSICYDIRFAELFSVYAKAEVDIILVPAAFLIKTGLAHWEVLLRARAIESQCYVIAPAQSGGHRSAFGDFKRETFGHSMLIDPWGKIIEVKNDGVGCFFVDLDRDLIRNMRQQIPMKSHRRIDF